MGKRLVLAGGGHAHLFTLSNLRKISGLGHRVTVIAPSSYYYHSGMGPGMVGGAYSPEAIRFDIKHAVEKNGCEFVLSYVWKVDPEKRLVFLETGDAISYDVVSFNVGSRIPRDILIEEGDTIFPVKPIEALVRARETFQSLLSTSSGAPLIVTVVGGGPTACEIAGNLFHAGKRSGGSPFLIRLFAGRQLLDQAPEKVRDSVREIFFNRGIDIIENDCVIEVRQNEIILESKRRWPSDLTFLATEGAPVPIFKKSGLETGPKGALRVNLFLQNPQYPEIFGGGACVHFKEKPLDTAWGYAIRQGRLLFHNFLHFMEGKPLKRFDPGKTLPISLNLGAGMGIFMKKNFFYQGKAAFLFKDFFDRRFMKIRDKL